MISQILFEDNQPDSSVRPAIWWENVRYHADRFFYLAHDFDSSADLRVQSALMANLIDQHEVVESMAYPPSLAAARSRLLDAMSQTMIGINSNLNNAAVGGQFASDFSTARKQLRNFQDELDLALAC